MNLHVITLLLREKQEMLIQLKELLSTFSERERDLFDYIHNQQLTYAEAAEKNGY